MTGDHFNVKKCRGGEINCSKTMTYDGTPELIFWNGYIEPSSGKIIGDARPFDYTLRALCTQW